jgi:large subunit ribosomal protein L14e
MEIGTICMKIAGREAGLYCVIVDKVDDSFVVITGPKTITRVKKRKCNINHLEPTSEKFDIKQEEDDSKIEELWKKSDLIDKFNIKILKKRTKEESKKQSKA